MANTKKSVKGKRALTLLALLMLMITLTACSNSVRRVALVSNGEEHERFENHHSFRSPDGSIAGGGGGMFCEDALEALVSMPLGSEPQIIVEGEQYRRPRYHFRKRIDDEWVTVLVVNTGNPDEVFLTHGQSREEWEQVYTETFFDLLEPGEYKLYISVSWGNSRSGMMGQYFFKFTV